MAAWGLSETRFFAIKQDKIAYKEPAFAVRLHPASELAHLKVSWFFLEDAEICCAEDMGEGVSDPVFLGF